jgi:hypothetical protein
MEEAWLTYALSKAVRLNEPLAVLILKSCDLCATATEETQPFWIG